MLLQRQYSLWKTANYFVGFLVVVMGLVIVFLNRRISVNSNDIKEKQGELLKIDKDIEKEKNKDVYRKYKIASVILSKENNTNYYGLYKYMKALKDDMMKVLRNLNISEGTFKLKVSKDSVKISLLVPNYNSLYEENNVGKDKNGNKVSVKGIFYSLSNKKFIKSININGYKKSSESNGIIFDLDIKTR